MGTVVMYLGLDEDFEHILMHRFIRISRDFNLEAKEAQAWSNNTNQVVNRESYKRKMAVEGALRLNIKIPRTTFC
ncbi:MAG: hypothetical protein GYA55_09395 [SAR324 cluster bacterium]|uniref:Uncharacterized protein n=1 Tax=SAR324 cluster bacterium TaxID=2024889 RepID=A0A7X9FS80_9DELT|nr:hypothetical protein [SAR324 cluster bacterium]